MPGCRLSSRRKALTPSHNPLDIIPPQLDSEFVDDGHFHAFFQDLRLGASYLVTSEPVAFEAYFEYGIPASRLPVFRRVGDRPSLQTIEVGTTFAYRPPFLKWHFSLRTGFMADQVLGFDTQCHASDRRRGVFHQPALDVQSLSYVEEQ